MTPILSCSYGIYRYGVHTDTIRAHYTYVYRFKRVVFIGDLFLELGVVVGTAAGTAAHGRPVYKSALE